MGSISPTPAFSPIATGSNPPCGANATEDILFRKSLDSLSAQLDCRFVINSLLGWSFDSERQVKTDPKDTIYLMLDRGCDAFHLAARIALETNGQQLHSHDFQIPIEKNDLLWTLWAAKGQLEKWKAGGMEPIHRIDMPVSTEDEIIDMLEALHHEKGPCCPPAMEEHCIGLDDATLTEHCLSAFKHYLNEPVFIEEVSSNGARRTASTDEWIPDIIMCRKKESAGHNGYYRLETPSADHTRLLFSENEGVLTLKIGQIRNGALRRTDKIRLPGDDGMTLCRGVATARKIASYWKNQPQAASQAETDELQSLLILRDMSCSTSDLAATLGKVHADRFAGPSNAVTRIQISQASQAFRMR